MKTFNQIVSDSFEEKSKVDYTNTLVENQSHIAYKTYLILAENTDIDDADPASENEGVPFRSPGPGPGKYYLHVDVDGVRKLIIVDTPQEAQIAAKSFGDTSKELYNFKGDQVNIDAIGESFKLISEDGAEIRTRARERKEFEKNQISPEEQPQFQPIRPPAEEKGFYDAAGEWVREWRRRGARSAVNAGGDIEALENFLIKSGAMGPGSRPLKTTKQRDEEVQKELKELEALQKEWTAKGFAKAEDIQIPKEEIEAYKEFIERSKEGPSRPGKETVEGALGARVATATAKARLSRYQDFVKRTQGLSPEQLRNYYEKNPEMFEKDESLLPSALAVETIPLSVAENRPEGALPKGIQTGTARTVADLGTQMPEIAAIGAAAYAAPIGAGAVATGAGTLFPSLTQFLPAAGVRQAVAQGIGGAFALQGAEGLRQAKDPVAAALNAAMLAGGGKALEGGARAAAGAPPRLPRSMDPMALMKDAIERARAQELQKTSEAAARRFKKSEAKVGAKEAELEAGAAKQARRASVRAKEEAAFKILPWLKYFDWGKKTPKLPTGAEELTRQQRREISGETANEVKKAETTEPRKIAKELTAARIEAEQAGTERPELVRGVSSGVRVGMPSVEAAREQEAAREELKKAELAAEKKQAEEAKAKAEKEAAEARSWKETQAKAQRFVTPSEVPGAVGSQIAKNIKSTLELMRRAEKTKSTLADRPSMGEKIADVGRELYATAVIDVPRGARKTFSELQKGIAARGLAASLELASLGPAVATPDVAIARPSELLLPGRQGWEATQARMREELPKPEAPKPEAPKAEAPKAEAPKAEAPKPEAPKAEAPKPEAPKPEAPKAEAPVSVPPPPPPQEKEEARKPQMTWQEVQDRLKRTSAKPPWAFTTPQTGSETPATKELAPASGGASIAAKDETGKPSGPTAPVVKDEQPQTAPVEQKLASKEEQKLKDQEKGAETQKEKETQKNFDMAAALSSAATTTAAVAATAGAIGLGRTAKKAAETATGKKGTGLGGGFAPEDFEKEEIKPGAQGEPMTDWNLLVKNIYGKYAGTLTK